MMRTIVAILALSPAMLYAQANVPAQPSSTPVLLSSLASPAASGSNPDGDARATSTTVRVTSGVVPPTLIGNPSVELSPAVPATKQTVVIDLTVDATGKPTNLKIAESSSDRFLDADALNAVSAMRFKPATLDGQPTAVPMRLNYVMQHRLGE